MLQAAVKKCSFKTNYWLIKSPGRQQTGVRSQIGGAGAVNVAYYVASLPSADIGYALV